MCRTLFGTVARTVFVTVLSLAGVGTLWAQDYGGLSVDTKFSPGEVGYYYVNMPATGTKEVTVPDGVLSFKVYDDGGKDGNVFDQREAENPIPGDYSLNCNGYLKLTAPEGYLLKLSGMIRIEAEQAGGEDYLTVFDGADTGETARRLIDRLCSTPYDGSEPENEGQYDDWPRKESVKPVVSTGRVITLYFYSDDFNCVEGLDLVVTLVPEGQTFSISSTEVTGGAVTAQAEAKPHDEVALTAQPETGYMLAAVSVKDGDGFDVELADGLLWYSPAQSTTFHMPADEVTVTPTFTNTWTAEGGLYINMPWKGTRTAVIPAGVRSFKVYDDGGEGGNAHIGVEHPDNGGNYRNNCDGYLELIAPEGYVLRLSGTITTEDFRTYTNIPGVHETDWLDVYDGTSTSDKLLNKVHGIDYDKPFEISTVTTSAERMTLYFHSSESWVSEGLDLKVEVIPVESAKHLVKISAAAGGTVTSNVTKEQKGNVVTLTVTPDEGYVLSSLDVVDDWGQPVSLAGDTVWYSTGTPPSFVMPVHGVTVIPHFTSQLTAEGGLSVNMPLANLKTITIPAGVQSFKVYDSDDNNCANPRRRSSFMQLTAPEDNVFKLSIQDVSGWDQDISVYDGSYEDRENAPLLIDNIPSYWNDEGERLEEPDEQTTVYSTNRTMTIMYSGYPCTSSFEFLVTLVDASDAHAVKLTTVEGGNVQASATSAKVGTPVTLTVSTDEGYLLTGIDVIDAHGDRRIPTNVLHCFADDNTATFIMPVADVTVTPHFTKNLTADGGLYINLPKTGTLDVAIPAGVQSFKVYDDGGEGGTNVFNDNQKGLWYSFECDGYLKLTAPEGYVLQLSGQITLEEDWDYLTVYDGDVDGHKLIDSYTSFPDDDVDETAPTCDITTTASTGRTMTIHMTTDDEFCFAGLDLTVTLIDASQQHDIAIQQSTGGTVEADVDKAPAGTPVKLTVTPDRGYALSEISVADIYGNELPLLNEIVLATQAGTATFIMPVYDVTITPRFTNQPTAEGGLFVNMPKTGTKSIAVPHEIHSFKVFDDGGKIGKYSNFCDGYLELTAPEGYKLQLSGTISSEPNYDYLTVFDGDKDSSRLIDKASSKFNNNDNNVMDELPPVTSSGRKMTLHLYSDGYNVYDGLDLTVTLVPDEDLAHTIVINNTTGGRVTYTGDNQTIDENVLLTFEVDEGYVLSDIQVVDFYGNPLQVYWTDEQYLKNTLESYGYSYDESFDFSKSRMGAIDFDMPGSDAFVTPIFSQAKTAEGGLYVNMPWGGSKHVYLPADVTSLKVYDDGGEGRIGLNPVNDEVETEIIGSANYGNDCDGYLQLTAPEGYVLQLSGTIFLEAYCDFLTVFDGDENSRKLIDEISSNYNYVDDVDVMTELPTVTSSGRSMTLHLSTDGSVNYDGLDLTVTLLPAVTLLDNDSESDTKNADVMAAAQEMETPYAVVLKDRQMTKNGEWNTLCLPFGVTDGDEDDELSFTGTPLEGAIVRELDADNSNLSADGVLTLTFKDAERIEAGKPYIVKWTVDGSAGENDDEVQPLMNPVFCGVNIARTEPVAVTFANAQGSACSFVGQFAPFAIDADNQKEVLMLTTGNRIGYTASDRMLRAFRAHFDVPAVSGQARRFVLDFGDSAQGDATKLDDKSIRSVDNATDTWYDLQGRRLNGEPKRKGLYIKNRKKVKQNL